MKFRKAAAGALAVLTLSLGFAAAPEASAKVTKIEISNPQGRVGRLYTEMLVASADQDHAVTFTANDALPEGLTLKGAEITGIPTKAGTVEVTFVATDTVDSTSYEQTVTFDIRPNSTTPSVSATPTATATVTQTVTPSQSASATPSGTPSVKPVPSSSITTPKVTPAATIELGADAKKPATVGLPYSARPILVGYTGKVTWSTDTNIKPDPTKLVTVGFPAGLTLDPATGTISGTPTKVGVYLFGLDVKDAAGNLVASDVFVLTVDAAKPGPAAPGVKAGVKGKAAAKGLAATGAGVEFGGFAAAGLAVVAGSVITVGAIRRRKDA